MMISKTIVITGGSRGLGFGLAKEFLNYGHQVVINGRSEKSLSRALEELERISPDVRAVKGSVNNEETHQRIVEGALDAFGKIDIWINNAGIPQSFQEVLCINNNEIQSIVDTNIVGLIIGTKTAANQMLKQGYGKIFNMEGFGSDGRIMKKLSIYGTTKRAISYFTKSFSREIGMLPIQAGILNPGMVRTDFLNQPEISRSPEESKRFKKVYDILAEDVNVVSKFLAERILRSSKNYDRIVYLTKTRLMVKMFRMLLG